MALSTAEKAKYSKKRLVTYFAFLILLLLPLVFLTKAIRKDASVKISHAQSPGFTFTAAGDYGQGSDTTSVLKGIANSGASFNLAFGDLSYKGAGSETGWCNFVKSSVGSTFPFELVAGNHEDDGPDGDINNFAACLPDRMGNIAGTYAKEYYFDYQGLARFIQISPSLVIDGTTYSYKIGTPRYNWLLSAIDQARASGLKWVVVTEHEDCLSAGVQGCDIGADLLNLLVSKRVDLVIEGHDHNYQRSKQISTNSSCTILIPGRYDPSCVADDGSDNLYTKGLGTVFVIAGTGGIGFNNINTSDPEISYFSKYMGGNINPRKGFMKFQVTNQSISANFVGTTNTSNFSDSFVIGGGSPTSQTPTPSLSSVPPGGNIILNPSFENSGSSWLSPWEWGVKTGASGTISQDSTTQNNGNYSAKANITQAGTEYFLQLLQRKIPLTKGVAYTVSFYAKASSNRNVKVAVQQAYSPYTGISSKSFSITTLWQKYSFSFTPAVNETNAMIDFNLAANTGQVFIDDVSFSR